MAGNYARRTPLPPRVRTIVTHQVGNLQTADKKKILDFVAETSFRGKRVVELVGDEVHYRVEFDPSRLKNGLVMIAAVQLREYQQWHQATVEELKLRGTYQPDATTRRSAHYKVVDHEPDKQAAWEQQFKMFVGGRKKQIQLGSISTKTSETLERAVKYMHSEEAVNTMQKHFGRSDDVMYQLELCVRRQLEDIVCMDLPTWHDIGLVLMILGVFSKKQRQAIWDSVVPLTSRTILNDRGEEETEVYRANVGDLRVARIAIRDAMNTQQRVPVTDAEKKTKKALKHAENKKAEQQKKSAGVKFAEQLEWCGLPYDQRYKILTEKEQSPADSENSSTETATDPPNTNPVTVVCESHFNC